MRMLALGFMAFAPFLLLLWWSWRDTRDDVERNIVAALVEHGRLNSTEVAAAIGMGGEVRRVEAHILRLVRRGDVQRTASGKWELSRLRLATEHEREEGEGGGVVVRETTPCRVVLADPHGGREGNR